MPNPYEPRTDKQIVDLTRNSPRAADFIIYQESGTNAVYKVAVNDLATSGAGEVGLTIAELNATGELVTNQVFDSSGELQRQIDNLDDASGILQTQINGNDVDIAQLQLRTGVTSVNGKNAGAVTLNDVDITPTGVAIDPHFSGDLNGGNYGVSFANTGTLYQSMIVDANMTFSFEDLADVGPYEARTTTLRLIDNGSGPFSFTFPTGPAPRFLGSTPTGVNINQVVIMTFTAFGPAANEVYIAAQETES